MNVLIPLFSPATGTWGGLTRAVAVAHAAEAAGHRVAFCASGYLAGNLRGRGYRVYPMPAPTLFGLPRWCAALVARAMAQMTATAWLGRLLGSIWGVLFFSGVIAPRYLGRLVSAELRAARDYHTDAIFTDLDPAAFIVARSLNVPVATAYATPMAADSGSWAWRRTRRAIAPLLARCGLADLDPDALFFGPDVLKLVPSIPELDGADAVSDDIRYVGPLLGAIEPGPADAFQPEPGRRYVFCYMGSGSVSAAALRRVLPEVFADGDLTCIVSGPAVGRRQDAGNVRYCTFVDVRVLLPQCVWTICHGGQSTIVQSLQAGVPLLIFPGSNAERRHNAASVQAQGAGFVGEPDDWQAAWLRAHLAQADEPARQAARLGARLRAMGGPSAAVHGIEEWVRRAAWRRESDGAYAWTPPARPY
ncbi:MAG: glycosyltransferase [Anaerolineae bacterium]